MSDETHDDSDRDDSDRDDSRTNSAANGGRRDALGDPEWPVLDSKAEYETGWFTGGYDRVRQPDGTEKQYYWAELSTAVVVVAVAEGHVLFVEQYRPTVRETQLELPAGIVEQGESFTQAAERELREETGFEASSLSLLQEFWTCTGLLRHRRGIVFAEGLSPGERELDSNEFLTPKAVPIDDAVAVARAQPTNDATIEGLLLAKDDGLL
ncbi:NUDIX hydrolase [Haloprofundus halophilus]|uniref:NUDIX hydrolase n=1 Tax=Haloprofundus halophilus TaxID=2283527 RepID=UPI000E4308CD|nr:NUDIX hydrolase [Haloprofundus halophilus]